MTITRLLPALLAAAILGSCGTPPRAPGSFTFAVVGDTPYSPAEERRFLELIDRVNAEDVDFTIHVGDFKGGERCSDELFARRRAQFDTFARPLVYTPGDNEWTDCHRRHMGSMDPIERLAKLRQVFFGDTRFSLGRTPMATLAQDACLAPPVAGCGCGALPENRAWTRSTVKFVTLDIPGSDNNMGRNAANDAEARCRDEGNRRWLEAAVREAEGPGVRALVVAIQANPWDSKLPVYQPFLAQLEEAAARLNKPVLLIHGDTHTYRADSPFKGPIGNGRPWPQRLETYGSPFVGWVKVTVDPASPDPFRYEPRMLALVPTL